MKIAVTTPTGNVGHHVVRMLIRAGIRPTVLARTPNNLEQLVRDNADATQVDQSDRDAVAAATEGVDALFWVNPPGTGDDPIEAYARLGEVAAAAVTENQIGLREGFRPEQPRSALTTTPSTLGAWSYDVLRPLLAS